MNHTTKRERDIAIDIVKFMAVFLIINSHADIMYPKLKILATGGAIGDCLFLFCSGFTLFMGAQASFVNYYKRRIARIYPSVFTSVTFIHIVSQNPSIEWSELVCAKPFIVAIMVYYIFLYFIRKYAISRINLIFATTIVISLLSYIWFPYKYETGSKGLYGITSYYRWIPYFGAMLLGAYIGIKRKSLRYDGWMDFIKLMVCILFFYSIQFAAKKYPPVAPWQIVTIAPLMGIVVYFYKWCNNGFFRKIYESKAGKAVILTIGGLCLESYLIQYALFTSKLNHLWPLNLLIITLLILVCSYIVRCAARLFVQTFRTEDYELKKIISLH